MKTLRLNNIDEWTKVGKGVELIDTKPRKVRIMLNVDGIASVYWKQGNRKAFLGLAQGLTGIEFDTVGKGRIVTEGATAWWRCTEVQHRQVGEAEESFAQPHEPRQRNYELELVMAKAAANTEQRMQQMEKMYAKRLEQLERQSLQSAGGRPGETADPGDGADQAVGDPGPAANGAVSEPPVEQQAN